MLFWVRKFKMNKIPLLLSNDILNKFFLKIDQNIDKNYYNFKNLVNIYYDYSFINRSNEKLLR
jgi:hypothetical protein